MAESEEGFWIAGSFLGLVALFISPVVFWKSMLFEVGEIDASRAVAMGEEGVRLQGPPEARARGCPWWWRIFVYYEVEGTLPRAP